MILVISPLLQEFNFFLNDDELRADKSDATPERLPEVDETQYQNVLVKLLEIGGDFIEDLILLTKFTPWVCHI